MSRISSRLAAIVLLGALLTACGGGDSPVSPPPTPSATIAVGAATASIVAGATTPVAVTLTRGGGFAGAVTVTAASLPTGVTASTETIAAGATTATITLTAASNAAAATAAAVSVTGTGSGVTIAAQTFTLTVAAAAISQIGADITNVDGQFGGTIALSADGTRMVVGATTSTGGNGTTRVYQRTGSTWAQLGSNIVGEAADDRSGSGVAINAAGTRIAIGAWLNDGNGSGSGHVRVFDLVGTIWTQVGADIDGGGAVWALGWRVALSASGSRLVASGPGINTNVGFLRVYDLVAGTWTQVGATLTGNNDFGGAVDISSDGTTIAVGAPSAVGSGRVGTVQVLRLSGASWTLLGNELTEVSNANTQSENFGFSISLTANGTRIAVASPQNKEAAPAGSNRTFGQVRVFDLIGGTWTPVGNAVNGLSDIGGNNDQFGETLMLSDDGTRWAATGASNSIAKVYSLVGGAWVQTGSTIVAPSGVAQRSEGLALSPDGKTVAIGYVNGSPRRVAVFSITP